MSRKEFTINEGNKEVKLTFRTPQYEDVKESDMVYASKVATLLKQGRLLLRSDLEKYFKEHKIWTVEDEQQVEQLNKKIDDLLSQMRRGGKTFKEGRQICLDIRDTRIELYKLTRKRQMFDDTTVEALAENEKIDYLIYTCTVYAENGKNYWDSFEDMKNDKASEVYNKARGIAFEMIYNIDADFEKNLPENKWLKKNGFVDDDLRYLDRKTGKRVDRDGNLIESDEQFVNRQLENMQGDIEEEVPFVDEEAPTEEVTST